MTDAIATIQPPTMLIEAQRLFDADLALLPNDARTKHPHINQWQSCTFPWPVLEAHLQNGGALGLRQGDADGETIDLDSKHWIGADPDELRQQYETLVEDTMPGLLARLVIQRTQSGGRHYIYRCATIEGNLKLAERPPSADELTAEPKKKAVTLIETRGKGGQIQIAPTKGYTILRGDLAAIPTIAAHERVILFSCARALNAVAKPSRIDQNVAQAAATGLRPGDMYNANGGGDEALQLLEADGWSIARSHGSVLYLVRPGKQPRDGISATFGHTGTNQFYVFSSNASPFEPNHTYSPFAVKSLLKHNGDFTETARDLASRGYGSLPAKRPAIQPTTNTPAPEPTTAEPLAPGQGPVSTRIRTALTCAGYTFRLNELDNCVEVNGERLADEIEAEIIMAARDADARPIEAVRPFIISEARRNPYHPIRDYLNGLAWDGGSHIDTLCHHLTSSDPHVSYPSGGPLPLHQIYIYRWLIGSVAKVFEQAQNMALVLAGPQNLGKSTFARWLCSGLGNSYFLEMPIDPHDKDNDLRQMRTFIWEIAELDATTRKADISALKAFITRRDANVRKAYGRYDTTRPTVANFIGTVNKGVGFLSDSTGNRRFMVTTLTAIDHAYTTAIDVNQVWAQAVALYRQGEPWQLQVNEQQAQQEANAEHELDSPLEGWLQAHFDTAAGDTYAMTSGEIIDHLRQHYGIQLSGGRIALGMEISTICQRMGIERRRLDPKKSHQYIGIRPKMPGEP